MARGYSYHEWSQLSAAPTQRIYHERDRTNTAWTVAAIMQEQVIVTHDSNNVSQVSKPTFMLVNLEMLAKLVWITFVMQ